MRKLKISVKIINDDGKTIVKTVSERSVPYLKEFEKQGFAAAFDDLVTAVLEARKEACTDAVSKYVSILSKKN